MEPFFSVARGICLFQFIFVDSIYGLKNLEIPIISMSQLATSQVSQHETRAFEVQRGLQRWGCRSQGENDGFLGVYLPHTRRTNRNCTNLGVLPNSLKTRPTKMFIEFVSLSASQHGDLVRQLMFEQIKWKGSLAETCSTISISKKKQTNKQTNKHNSWRKQ